MHAYRSKTDKDLPSGGARGGSKAVGEGDRMSEHAARSSPDPSLQATERTVAMSAIAPHSGAGAASPSTPSPGIEP